VRFNVCDDDVVDVQPVGRRCRPCQPRAHGWIKPCSTHCTTVDIPFRTNMQGGLGTAQTWPLPTSMHFALPPTVVSGNSAQFSPTTGVCQK
jgi:hypothetical protein